MLQFFQSLRQKIENKTERLASNVRKANAKVNEKEKQMIDDRTSRQFDGKNSEDPWSAKLAKLRLEMNLEKKQNLLRETQTILDRCDFHIIALSTAIDATNADHHCMFDGEGKKH